MKVKVIEAECAIPVPQSNILCSYFAGKCNMVSGWCQLKFKVICQRSQKMSYDLLIIVMLRFAMPCILLWFLILRSGTRLRWIQKADGNEGDTHMWGLMSVYIGPPCKNHCSGRGGCHSHQCYCDDGYGRTDCSQLLTTNPVSNPSNLSFKLFLTSVQCLTHKCKQIQVQHY